MQKTFSEKTERILSMVVFLVLVTGVAWFKYTYHEFWKDEWQAWFVAKDKSLPEIISFLNYEGHPALWYLFLKPFTLFSSYFLPENIVTSAHLITVVLAF